GRIVAAALTQAPELRGVIHGVWSAFFMPVKPLALIAGCGGVVLAAGGGAMLGGVDPLPRFKGRWRWLTGPLHPRAQIGRAILVLAAGTYAVSSPSRAMSGVVAIAGLVLVYLGLREVFRVVLARTGMATAARAATTDQPPARAWRTAAAVAVVLVVVLGGTALLVFRAPATLEEEGAVTACNGYTQLCNRRLDQVVFAGAHNAMSNAEIPGWLFPHHNHAFPGQLEDGVRALLIDVHYGVPAEEHVITDFDREGGTSVDKIRGALGPEATDAAVRIRNRFMGHETGTSALYFCHGFCELGAYPVVPALQGIRDWMVANPGEVVIIVVEDYVTPQDLAGAFQDAGLLNLVYTGPVTQPFPTLRQLIDRDQRLVVFTESGKPGVPWLYPAWASMQETPYSFHKPSDFSCRPNRGPASAPFFQINNWIETTPAPKPSNAEIVNAYDALLARARECRTERHRLPNILAVDFYDVGDLFGVVRTLNGLGGEVRGRGATAGGR